MKDGSRTFDALSTPGREEYRPAIHFTPEQAWMNDPNGLVFFEGEYHLFYQYHPGSTVWGPMHWGHAVSEDLVHWRHLPVALQPDRLGTIFSGSAVVDSGDSSGYFGGKPGLVAIYTQHGEGGQKQSVAFSTDRGRTWTKYEGNPVIANPGLEDFRDPKVIFHASSERWVMTLACGDRVRFYSSPDLKTWSFESEFGASCGAHGGVWECPDLFELPVAGREAFRVWVLKVDLGDGAPAGGSGGQYFTGKFDGRCFLNDNPPETTLWLEFGADFYAAQSWSDLPAGDPRRIWIAWMSNWRYANAVPTKTFRSAMTIPREVSLVEVPRAGLRLVQRPVRELDRLRRTSRRRDRVSTTEAGGPVDLLAGLGSDGERRTFELLCVFVPSREKGASGLVIRTGEAGETRIGYDAAKGTVFFDRTRSGEDSFSAEFALRHETQYALTDGRLSLRLFIDRSSIELFADDGKLVFTELVFPHPGCLRIDPFTSEGEAVFEQIEAFALG